jgi:replication-associated recombination protein RarA
VQPSGLPEARIPLAHATAYMCRAAKNREAYEALGAAEEIESERTERVPERLKNKHFPVNPSREKGGAGFPRSSPGS